MASAVEQKVKQIIVEQLGVDESQVDNKASFVDDLGADSLDIWNSSWPSKKLSNWKSPTKTRRRSRPSATLSPTSKTRKK